MRTRPIEVEGVQRVSGTVSTGGAIVAGTGFSVVGITTGQWGLRIPGLRAIRSVTITPDSGGYFTAYLITQPNQVTVYSWNASVVAANSGFSFSVDGFPR
jgi:hypothetical protein